MEAAAAGLMALILRPENFALIAAVAVIIATARKVMPSLFARPTVVRFLPLAPLVLCTAGQWIPWVGAPAGAGARVLLGILLGAAVGQAHKVLKQTGLGIGIDEPEATKT